MKLVFVSSTFKDMQLERDVLQAFAIPTLTNNCMNVEKKRISVFCVVALILRIWIPKKEIAGCLGCVLTKLLIARLI